MNTAAAHAAPGLVAAIVAAALIAGCAGSGPSKGPPVTTGTQPGLGSGFFTTQPAYLRPLRPDVSVTAIITVGDTLFPSSREDEAFLFFPRPDGLGARAAGNGLVEVYVAHELGWQAGTGGARVSRMVLNQRSAGLLNGDYLLDGSEDYTLLCAATLVGAREGFLGATFLINEESTDGPRHGVVGAVDVFTGSVKELPWLGRFRHESTIVLTHSSGKTVAILTEDAEPGYSQLYMYLASSSSDLLAGRGRLHVFRADPPSTGVDTRFSSMATRSRPLSGRFVPCDNPSEFAIARQPSALEARAQSVGCLNFVRLEDVEVDPERSDAFYFADTGSSTVFDPASGRLVTGNGRIYRATLDPLDPTRVARLEVILDGDEADDLFRPDNLGARENTLMIQEDPGRRGLHPARILRYDTVSRRLEPIAVCAERDVQGRILPQGTGGEWESTGIIDVSDLFGGETWLTAVQAPTVWSTAFGSRGGGGQLLLLRMGRGGSAP